MEFYSINLALVNFAWESLCALENWSGHYCSFAWCWPNDCSLFDVEVDQTIVRCFMLMLAKRLFVVWCWCCQTIVRCFMLMLAKRLFIVWCWCDQMEKIVGFLPLETTPRPQEWSVHTYVEHTWRKNLDLTYRENCQFLIIRDHSLGQELSTHTYVWHTLLHNNV